MGFKRNITITLACVITECLISLIPMIFIIYLFFMMNKVDEIFSTLLIVPYFILIINVILIIISFIAQIFIQYTLPLRSILWGMWYKELNGGKLSLNVEDKPKAKKKHSAKRPSEKLMDESHKKYAKKQIARNILRRAMEKEDKE